MRLGDADVAHAAGLPPNASSSAAGCPKSLTRSAPGDVEALVIIECHVGVELVALARDGLQPAPQPARRQQEDGQQDERDQRELPAEEEHDDQHDDDADEVADHRGEDVGEGLLGAGDVVVQAADERAGLGAA